MKLVVDASVAVKWVLRDQPGELDVDRATALLGAISRGARERRRAGILGGGGGGGYSAPQI